MPTSFDCPLCSSMFATIGDGHDWRSLAGIRLVEHLATAHQLSARQAWAMATPVILAEGGTAAERERERAAEQQSGSGAVEQTMTGTQTIGSRLRRLVEASFESMN